MGHNTPLNGNSDNFYTPVIILEVYKNIEKCALTYKGSSRSEKQ